VDIPRGEFIISDKTLKINITYNRKVELYLYVIHKYLICCLQGISIDSCLHRGSNVKFSCHGFDETGQEQCGYFVTVAWRQDPIDLCSPNADINASVFVGIYNASGTVSEVSHRQGVITYVDANGEFNISLVS